MADSPLRAAQSSLGARFREVDGVEVVAAYGEVAAEVEAVRKGATVSDRSQRGRLAVTGPDRATFVGGQATADVEPLAPGEGVYTTFLTGKGKMRGDGVVLAEAERLWILCAGEATVTIADHLASFIIMEDVAIEDRGAATVELGVHGPGSAAALGDALGAEIRADLTEHAHQRLPFAGGEALLVATRATGLEGFELIVDAADAPALWQRLAGALPCVGADALETLRIEAGLGRWGADMDEDTIPIEAGLERAIDYEKGCFTGYEVLARIRTYGHVNRNLRGLRIAGAEVPAVGTAVVAEDKPVGAVTSATRSERLGGPIALAMLRREVAEPGTRLILASGAAVEVVALPFAAEG